MAYIRDEKLLKLRDDAAAAEQLRQERDALKHRADVLQRERDAATFSAETWRRVALSNSPRRPEQT